MDEAEENWLEDQSNEIEKKFIKGKSKQSYITLEKLTRSGQVKTVVLKDEDDKLL